MGSMLAGLFFRIIATPTGISYYKYGPRGRGLGTRFSFRLSIQKLAPGPGQRKPRTPPTDASHAAGRVGGGRSSCGARRSRAGIGARQPLWVTHTHQAGRRRWQGARRMETRWRGAARGDNRAIVASPGSARMPSPTSPCNAPTLPFATVPVGAALETPAASNLRAPTRPMARLPRGERKDALDTVA